MESQLLIGWQKEKEELKQEVCHLQEELAESRAEREELESRSRALHDRVRRTAGHVINRILQMLHLPLSLFSCARKCPPRLPFPCKLRGSRESGGGDWGRGERGRPDKRCSSIGWRTRCVCVCVFTFSPTTTAAWSADTYTSGSLTYTQQEVCYLHRNPPASDPHCPATMTSLSSLTSTISLTSGSSGTSHTKVCLKAKRQTANCCWSISSPPHFNHVYNSMLKRCPPVHLLACCCLYPTCLKPTTRDIQWQEVSEHRWAGSQHLNTPSFVIRNEFFAVLLSVCNSNENILCLQLLEYRDHSQHLELRVLNKHTQLLNTEVRHCCGTLTVLLLAYFTTFQQTASVCVCSRGSGLRTVALWRAPSSGWRRNNKGVCFPCVSVWLVFMCVFVILTCVCVCVSP